VRPEFTWSRLHAVRCLRSLSSYLFIHSRNLRAADNAYLKKFVQAWIRWHFLRIKQKTGEACKTKNALNLLGRRKMYLCLKGWSDYAYNKREFVKPEFTMSSRALRRGMLRRTFHVRRPTVLAL
jgi:hypothetical protein